MPSPLYTHIYTQVQTHTISEVDASVPLLGKVISLPWVASASNLSTFFYCHRFSRLMNSPVSLHSKLVSEKQIASWSKMQHYI